MLTHAADDHAGSSPVVDAHRELRAAEARYRRLLSHTHAIVLECTPRGEILFANDAAAQALGASSPHALVGSSAGAFFHEISKGQFERNLELFARGMDLRGERIQMVTSAGESRVVEWSTANHYDDDGRLTRIVGLGINQTHRELAERALHEAEARFRAAMDALPVGVCVLRDNGFRYVNRRAAALFGYEPEEMVGGLRPVDVAAPHERERVRHATLNRLAGAKGEPGDLEFVRRDGGRFIGNVRVALVEGGHGDIVVSIVDITEHRRTQAALQESERMARSTLDGLSAHLCIVDHDGVIVAVNAAWRAFAAQCGADPQRACEGANYLEACRAAADDEHAARFLVGFSEVVRGQRDFFHMAYACHGPTERRWFEVRITRFPGKGPTRLIVAHEDVTPLQLAERSMRINQLGLDHANVGVYLVDALGDIVYVNGAAAAMLGYERDHLLGRAVAQVVPSVAERGWPDHFRTLRRLHGLSYETVHRARDGMLIPVEMTVQYLEFDGEPYLFGYAKDIRARREAERRADHLLHFDLLTGLPNRRLFTERLRQAIDNARDQARALAALIVDIDRLARLNESLGHSGADRILADIALRLGRSAQGAVVGRFGGDQFGIFWAADRDRVDPSAAHLARRVLDALAEPFDLDGTPVYVTCTIGAAFYPRDYDDPEALLRGAATAARIAKRSDRGKLQFHMPESDARAREWLLVDANLRQAVAAGSLRLEYQPQVNLTTGAVTTVEALLRVDHPALRQVPTDRIIAVAEETGLIATIGDWVLRTACAQTMTWRRGGLPQLGISVNVSPRQIHAGDLVGTVRRVLAETGLPARALELELTETSVLQDVDRARETFRALRETGVRLALDDFGTGYSSLSYLRLCPVDTVKLDTTFVRDAGTPDGAAIPRAVINMAHALNLMVVAEGVENEAQLTQLLAYQCDSIQGDFFSRPLAPDALAAMLREGRKLDVARLHARRERTLLLVDDEENILAALRRLLRRDGYQIFVASSAQEGLEVLAKHEIDVIVSDQRMPGTSGVEFLRRAKELFPDTVRIVLSGFTELQSITDAVNEGAIYRFLTKPWDDQQLRGHIAEAFRTKELDDENRRLQHALRGANRELADVNSTLQQVLEGQREAIDRGATSLEVARHVLDAVPAPVLGLDPDGTLVFSNAAAIACFGPVAAELGAVRLQQLCPALLVALEDRQSNHSAGIAGRHYRVSVRDMGTPRSFSGTVLVMVPDEDEPHAAP